MKAPKQFQKQLLEAVYQLHNHNIVHRDLKPANILVKKDQIFLCDFGLSRSLNADFSSGTGYIVSKWYRAPEIYFNTSDHLVYTKKMDCWSVGCILYEIENNKPLNSDMSFKFKVNNIIQSKLLEMDSKKRWSMKDCLNITGLKSSKSVKMKLNNDKWIKKFPDKKLIFSLANKLNKEKKYFDEFLMLSILVADSSKFWYLINEELDINLDVLYKKIKDETIFYSIFNDLIK